MFADNKSNNLVSTGHKEKTLYLVEDYFVSAVVITVEKDKLVETELGSKNLNNH